MSLPLPRYAQDATPVAVIATVCPMCGMVVRVPVVREFVRLWRRVCALAGTRFAADLPMIADRCPRGHVVTLVLENLSDVV